MWRSGKTENNINIVKISLNEIVVEGETLRLFGVNSVLECVFRESGILTKWVI